MASVHLIYNRTMFLGIVLMFLISGLKAQDKNALIVAIGSYSVESGWNKINSINDISLIENALVKQGFKKEDIVILSDAQATKKNIITAFDNHLINGLSEGDMAYFHFSGHGQQVQDVNLDELDGYDESIVPYDAKVKFQKGDYEGENHIIDDELNQLYLRLRKKLGPAGHFLLTIDACHSGTSTRGLATARGTTEVMAPSDYIDKKNEGDKRSDVDQHGIEQYSEASLASMVAFFGSMAHQLNYEVKGEDGTQYGALSYAFSNALSKLDADASYRGLFDQIRLLMSSRAGKQIPEAEGLLDQAILGGNFLGKTNYHTVEEWKDEKRLTLNAGFLQGLREGTVVGFYPPETRDIQNISSLAKGSIVSSNAKTSEVVLENMISESVGQNAWVFILEESFGDLIIGLDVQSILDSIKLSLLDQLFNLPYIEKNSKLPDLVLIEEGRELLLLSTEDILVESIPKSLPDNRLIKILKSAIVRFGQSEYLRKLDQKNSSIAVEFNFIPIDRNEKDKTESKRLSVKDKTDRNGLVHFDVGDLFKLEVINKGTHPAYYTILDIQPNNQINVLFPRGIDSPADYKIMPGETFEIPELIQIGPPLGQEQFKLIACNNPIDLRPIEQTRGLSTDDNSIGNPFEKLFSQTYYNEDLKTRGGRIVGLPSGLVNIYSKPFLIE